MTNSIDHYHSTRHNFQVFYIEANETKYYRTGNVHILGNNVRVITVSSQLSVRNHHIAVIYASMRLIIDPVAALEHCPRGRKK